MKMFLLMGISEPFCTNMQMKMFLLVLGLLVLKSSISMIEACAVELHLVSTFALLLIGFCFSPNFQNFISLVLNLRHETNTFRISMCTQYANGKDKQVTYVWPRLIGAAAAFANPWKESRLFIPSVVKILPFSGTPSFSTQS